MKFLKDFARKIAYSPEVFPFYGWVKSRKARAKLMRKLRSEPDLLSELTAPQREDWEKRIEDVLACPDNSDISRHPLAGNIVDGNLIMHNGIRVDPLSYYGYPALKMLMQNKGVHEPQEEKVFQEVLNSLAAGKKTMLELGSYWAFYSLWFLTRFPDAECFMLEPDIGALHYGKRNFKINGRTGRFAHAYVGAQENFSENITTPDNFCESNGIKFVDIFHADIQGFELEMLEGSKRMLLEKRIGYFFISTHSNRLHQNCLDFLQSKFGFSVVATANCDESFSRDGVLVMKAPEIAGVDEVPIAKRRISNQVD